MGKNLRIDVVYTDADGFKYEVKHFYFGQRDGIAVNQTIQLDEPHVASVIVSPPVERVMEDNEAKHIQFANTGLELPEVRDTLFVQWIYFSKKRNMIVLIILLLI